MAAAYPFPTYNTDMEKLYYSLTLAPDARKILNKLYPSLIVNKDTDEGPNIYPEIVDAWGSYFHYSYTPGNNFPVIDSNGPDKESGDDDDISSKD
jgi:hypothetical protein